MCLYSITAGHLIFPRFLRSLLNLHNNNIITAGASNKGEGLVQLNEMETVSFGVLACRANHNDFGWNGNNEQTCRIDVDGAHHVDY